MELIDNVNKTLKDDLTVSIQKDSKISIAAACFSIYAFQELKRELKNVDDAVFRDSCMANDSVATNFEQIFATYSPETVRKVL